MFNWSCIYELSACESKILPRPLWPGRLLGAWIYRVDTLWSRTKTPLASQSIFKIQSYCFNIFLLNQALSPLEKVKFVSWVSIFTSYTTTPSTEDIHHPRPVHTHYHPVRLSQDRDVLDDIQVALEELLLLQTDDRAAWRPGTRARFFGP